MRRGHLTCKVGLCGCGCSAETWACVLCVPVRLSSETFKSDFLVHRSNWFCIEPPHSILVCGSDWWYLIEDGCSENPSGRKTGSFEPQDWKQVRFCWCKDWKSAYQMVWEGKTEFHFRLWKCEWKLLSRVLLFPIPWTVARQTPLSMGFPRQEYWNRLPFPSPGDLSNSGI